jgi:hypothetical protein
VNTGTAAEYLYAELQVIEDRVDGTRDDPFFGHSVVAVRLNLGPRDPSRVLALSLRDARMLCNDLLRVFAELDETTEGRG